MGNLYYNGVQPIPEIRFQRNIETTLASDDFDGTDTANIADALKTPEANGSYFNPWIKGFLIQAASGEGEVDCITWQDYLSNGKVIDDTLAQPISLVVGVYSNVRVVKVFNGGATTDINIGV